jgi:hypothetical protein
MNVPTARAPSMDDPDRLRAGGSKPALASFLPVAAIAVRCDSGRVRPR